MFVKEVVLGYNLHMKIEGPVLRHNRVQLFLRNGKVVGQKTLIVHFRVVESLRRPNRLVPALTRRSSSEELGTGVKVDISINLELLVAMKHVG